MVNMNFIIRKKFLIFTILTIIVIIKVINAKKFQIPSYKRNFPELDISTKPTNTIVETIVTTTTNQSDKIKVTNIPTFKPLCGIGMGHCSEGYCCSRYGWCGKTKEYCNIQLGCQPEFGKCNFIEDYTSNDGRCGKGVGHCKEGFCCGKNGWCGKTKEFCDQDQGCQLGYGKCNSNILFKNINQCGENIGHCQKGYCCSKFGWCEKNRDSCDINKGCQPEYGKCNILKTSTSKYNQCGQGIGKCPKGSCCSKYGWCGKSEKYCNIEAGCQSEFGHCQSTKGRCGKNIGFCRKGECCSKYGWCGKSDNHCNMNYGCQSEFGDCNLKSKTNTKSSTNTKNIKSNYDEKKETKLSNRISILKNKSLNEKAIPRVKSFSKSKSITNSSIKPQ